MRPQQQVRDPLSVDELQRNVADAVGPGPHGHALDFREGDGKGLPQGCAVPQNHAPVRDRVDSRTGGKPGQQPEQRDGAQPQDADDDGGQQSRLDGAVLVIDRQAAQRGGEAEIEADFARMEGGAGQGAPIRRALPQDPFAARQSGWQTGNGFDAVFFSDFFVNVGGGHDKNSSGADLS